MLQWVVAPSRWYLAKLDLVDLPDQSLCRQISAGVAAVALTGNFLVRFSIPMDGVVIQEDLAERASHLRKLRPVERGAFLAVPPQSRSPRIVPMMPTSPTSSRMCYSKWMFPGVTLDRSCWLRCPQWSLRCICTNCRYSGRARSSGK